MPSRPLGIPLLLAGALWLVPAAASASHESQPFELPGTFGNDSVGITVLDALPAGDDPLTETDPRTVVLTFDLTLHGDWYGNEPGLETPFEVRGNGDVLLRTTFSTVPGTEQSWPGTYPADSDPYLGIPVPGVPLDFTLTFPLYYVEECCTDIGVAFERTGAEISGTWSLDNVHLDWSQPIPEPTTGLQLGLGLLVLGLRGRHRSPTRAG